VGTAEGLVRTQKKVRVKVTHPLENADRRKRKKATEEGT